MISESTELPRMEEKFTEEIFQHQAVIHKVCRMYRDNQEDREDLFQEITYQLWKSYPDFQGRSKLSTWMYRISLNTAMASFRKHKVHITYTKTIPETGNTFTTDADNPREVFAAIRTLDDDERAIIALYLEDMSYKEIADILGISESNVGVRLNRIKKKIKTLITEKDGTRRS